MAARNTTVEGSVMPIAEASALLDIHLVGEAFLTDEQHADLGATTLALTARTERGEELTGDELILLNVWGAKELKGVDDAS